MRIAPREGEVLADVLGKGPGSDSVRLAPSYIDVFLAHLRLLVGVPFHYLVPDARLLPDHAIRFFYLDRNWTDRLVDGAAAVGAVGARERKHAETVAADLHQWLDGSESLVRGLQRREITDYRMVRTDPDRKTPEAGTITGFLLRSALVTGWPHMEVRGLKNKEPLRILRLERLSPGVMIVLWDGVPDRVELEEPHHGIQFGVEPMGAGRYRAVLRKRNGEQAGGTIPVPMRRGGKGVVHVSALRDALQAASGAGAADPLPQTGSAALAIALLDPPVLQPFEGAGAPAPTVGGFVLSRLGDERFVAALRLLVGGGDHG